MDARLLMARYHEAAARRLMAEVHGAASDVFEAEEADAVAAMLGAGLTAREWTPLSEGPQVCESRGMNKRGFKLGIDWNQQPLGEVADREIGRRLGCAGQTVRHARIRRGIAAYSPQAEARR